MYDDKKRNIESLELPFFCNERTKPHLSQNTNNAREARPWRHNNDDIIKSD